MYFSPNKINKSTKNKLLNEKCILFFVQYFEYMTKGPTGLDYWPKSVFRVRIRNALKNILFRVWHEQYAKEIF